MKVYEKGTNKYLGTYLQVESNTLDRSHERIQGTELFVVYHTDKGRVDYERNYDCVVKEE